MKSISESALEAFEVHEKVESLKGGQGNSFRAGNIVLKPTVEGADWIAETLNGIEENQFRVSRPVAAKDGRWTSDGWCAWEFIPGVHDSSRLQEIIGAGREFHSALKGLPKPSFLEKKKDPWAVADRMAWGEIPLRCDPRLMPLLNQLVPLLKPLDIPSQVIHGDLIGNVLFEEGLPPGIIDFSPLWRPLDYALAIVVADALDWHRAGESALQPSPNIPDFYQLLVRAEIFRIAVYEGFHLNDGDMRKAVEGHTPTVGLLRKRLGK